MYDQAIDTVIPKYSLRDVRTGDNSMFQLLELDGTRAEHPAVFLAPHRKDYYLMVFVEEGNSRHWVDMISYTLKPNAFYFSVPHQIHVKEPAKPILGLILCFTDEFLAIEENEFLKQLPIIQNLHNGHELELKPENVGFVKDIFKKMLDENHQRNDWRNGMLLAYLRVLLIYVSRLYTEQFTNAELLNDRVLLKKFRALIEDQFNRLHDVAAYADLLFLTPGYLSEAIKQQSGKTAIEHIHERLMLEAKRLLFHTEYSIKEIAFQLGFEDASYFNRFFKRLSSQTPLGYRKDTRKMYH